MLPADEGLEGDDLAKLGIDDRLVGDRELVLEQGGAQVGLDQAALLGLGEHPRLEEGEALAALVLAVVEGEVGVAGDDVDRVLVEFADRNAHRGANIGGLAGDLVGQRQGLDDVAGDLLERCVRRVGEDGGEFVAAEPAGIGAFGQQLVQPGSDLEQQRVASLVTERVVDRLEAIEVDQHERAGFHPGPGADQALVEELADETPVGQAGEGVVASGVAQLDVGLGDRVAAALDGAEGDKADGEDGERGEQRRSGRSA